MCEYLLLLLTQEEESSVHTVAFSPDGEFIVVALAANLVAVKDVTRGTTVSFAAS